MIKFPEIFSEGLRRCTKAKVEFKIKENVTPIFRLKRKVPLEELDCLEQIGMLAKMNFREWASPTIYRKNKYRIRTCTDFSMWMNNCLETYNYPLPSHEDIFTKLSSGRVFSKLDLPEAYLNISIKECAKYLTIITIKVCIDSTDCHLG